MFFQTALAIAVLVILPAACQPNCDRDPDAQVLILGAGIAGLGAAQRLSQSGINDFLIIEQRDQIGGRFQSVQFAGATVELGPQWIFEVDRSQTGERLHPLWALAERCNVTVHDAPFTSLPNKFYNRQGEDITTSPEVTAAFERYLAAVGNVGNVLAGLRDDEDLTAGGGLREAGWESRSPVEETVRIFSF